MPNFSKKKLLLLGFLFVALLVIPLTVYLVQQQQNTVSKADKTTTLAFNPPNLEASSSSKINFDVEVLPGNNQIDRIVLAMKFDSTKLTPTGEIFKINPASGLSILTQPTAENDTISVSLHFTDSTKVITTNTTVGTVSFEIIGPNDTSSIVSFDQNNTFIYAKGSDTGNNQFADSVFLNGAPAKVDIKENAAQIPDTSPTPDVSPSPEATPSPTPDQSNNQQPVCENLTPDVATAGEAPYTITFTANGSDADGTIQKVSFNFGEGTVEDVLSGEGIGTATASASLAHTFNSGGEFSVSALLTDDKDGVSASDTCAATVVITGNLTATPSGDVSPLPPSGPNNAIIGLGTIGVVLAIIGTLLFFAL